MRTQRATTLQLQTAVAKAKGKLHHEVFSYDSLAGMWSHRYVEFSVRKSGVICETVRAPLQRRVSKVATPVLASPPHAHAITHNGAVG